MRLLAIMAVLALPACATTSLPEATSDGYAPVRRIVTASDAEGRSVVLHDGPTSNIVTLNGARIERLWETGPLPVPLAVERDAGALAGNAYRPGFVGSSLYVAEVPPGSGLEDIPIHAQDSLDYIVILEGTVDLVLDTGERVTMREDDVLVQAGNLHSWVNETEATVRLLVVVLTGMRAQPSEADDPPLAPQPPA